MERLVAHGVTPKRRHISACRQTREAPLDPHILDTTKGVSKASDPRVFQYLVAHSDHALLQREEDGVGFEVTFDVNISSQRKLSQP